MAYSTGIAADATALKTIIYNACIADGWVQTNNFISKGDSSVSLVDTNATDVTIQGARSPDGLTSPSTVGWHISIPLANWPVTYHLFINNSPETVCCVCNYGGVYIDYILFGDIVKLHPSAFIGGNYIFASRGNEASTLSYNLLTYANNFSRVAAIPFARLWEYSIQSLYTNIDNIGWVDTVRDINGNPSHTVQGTPISWNQLFYSPNTYNNQSILVPLHIQLNVSGQYPSYLGHLEHFRLIRSTNYNIGDIITLGTETWMTFPAHFKDVNNPNGSNVTGDTIGFAVRKV